RGLARGRRIVRIEPRTPRQNEGERHHATLDTPSEVHSDNSALSPRNQQLPQSLSRRLPSKTPAPPRQPSRPNPHPPRHPPHRHDIVESDPTPPKERTRHARKQRQTLPHPHSRGARPLGGDGHGPVLLHPGTAAHGRSPPLELRPRRMDRDPELRRLLHRHA